MLFVFEYYYIIIILFNVQDSKKSIVVHKIILHI